jgi:hypothetical protein
MSRIRANTIVNGAGTGAPNFPRGAIISGISTINAEISVGTGTSISSPGTNELALGTNNLERLRISGGRVGIGTTSPDVNLHIHAPNSGLSVIRLSGSAANQITYDIRQGIPGVNNAGFSIRDITNSENKFNITHTGDAQIVNGNLVFSTAGKGIDFSATGDSSGTMTSELLDDYEEGTFTPNLLLYASGSILETISPLNTSFKGRYTKIGNRVWVEIYARYNLSTITTSAWTQTFIELPFAQGAAGGQQYASAFIGYYSNFITYPVNTDSYHYFPGAYVGSSTNYLYLTINRMNGAETYIDETNISSNASAGIMVSANYCTESI